MKKITTLLFAVAFSAFIFPMFAQEYEQITETEKDTQSKNNWFISIGAGPNLLMGEQDSKKSVGDRLRFSGEFSVGKWFNPNFGARIQFMAGALKGYNQTRPLGGEQTLYRYVNSDRSYSMFPSGYRGSADTWRDPANWQNFDIIKNSYGEAEGYWQKFEYGTLSIDLMANLTNLFRGHHKDQNKVDIIPYIGLGWAHTIKSHSNPVHDGVVGKLGIRANFNINQNFGIYLEPQVNAFSEEFDGYEGNRGMDGVVNLMLGIQYTINRGFPTLESISQDEIDYLNRRINENRYLIENHQDILERQQDLLDKLQECCDEKEVTTMIVNEKTLPEYIRFGLDSYKIEQSEQKKISDVVDYLKTVPDSKLFLIGYADRKTGNPSYNLKLSQRRVDAVANELKRLGINSNRLNLEWKGDKEQPFSQNEWNRVVIMVER